ncbi:hypothetical protein FRC06_009233 [Ceratobasidium sp. 370]|nr:hypothetical protein FRC06_009233 [Ceratobasidium sp. 370]
MSVQSALNEWKATRTLLVDTIKSYRTASAALGVACARVSPHPLERAAVEQVLLDLDLEILDLGSNEEILRDTRISFLQLRNSSARLTRISALPPEVLTHILTLSRTYCVRDSEAKWCFNAVAEVNTQWRQIALSTPDMWTHIDIILATPESRRYSLAKVFFERSRDALVHVHISEPRSPTARLDIVQLANFLAPHLPRVHSLELHTRAGSTHLISFILHQWLNGNSAAPEALYIHRTVARELFRPENGEHGNVAPTAASGNQTNVVLPLRILHLQGAVFKWESPAYHGLVDLRLDTGPMSTLLAISVSQLANILSMSPKLGTLKLHRILITNPENWSPPAPIVLDCLQALNMVDLEPSSLQLVLPLIAQPNSSAQLSVGLTFYLGQLYDEIEAFFSRCRVATLYRESEVQVGLFWGIPVPIPHLVIANSDIETPQSITSERAQEVSLLPKPVCFHPITRLTLVSCGFTIEELASLVANHGVQTLRLDLCILEEIQTEDEPMEDTSDEDLRAALFYRTTAVPYYVLTAKFDCTPNFQQ